MPLDQSKRRGSEYRDSPRRGWGQANRSPQGTAAPRPGSRSQLSTGPGHPRSFSSLDRERSAQRRETSTASPSTPRANGGGRAGSEGFGTGGRRAAPRMLPRATPSPAVNPPGCTKPPPLLIFPSWTKPPPKILGPPPFPCLFQQEGSLHVPPRELARSCRPGCRKATAATLRPESVGMHDPQAPAPPLQHLPSHPTTKSSPGAPTPQPPSSETAAERGELPAIAHQRQNRAPLSPRGLCTPRPAS